MEGVSERVVRYQGQPSIPLVAASCTEDLHCDGYREALLSCLHRQPMLTIASAPSMPRTRSGAGWKVWAQSVSAADGTTANGSSQ